MRMLWIWLLKIALCETSAWDRTWEQEDYMNIGGGGRSLLSDPLTISGSEVPVGNVFVPQFEVVLTSDGDGRLPVQNPLDFPYNTIGKINMDCPCGKGQCTGQIIGPRSVLTAGHCVYDIKRCSRQPECCEKPCSNITFIPAYPVANETYLVDEVITPQGFISGFRNNKLIEEYGQFDITILKLSREIPTNIKTMSYGFFGCEDVKQDLEIQIAGYPYDLDGGEQMYYSQCTVNINRCNPSSIFYHKCDTEAGMSGAALWAVEGDSVVIIGVHSRATILNSTTLNVGVLLNRGSTGYISSVEKAITG